MKRLGYLMTLVGVIQLLLGLLYLFVPMHMLQWMGHSPVPADTAYPLGMLASRFMVYGFMLCIAARNPEENRLLVSGMTGIQLVDLLVGIYYTGTGIVSLHLSGFPMFNAAWISLLFLAFTLTSSKPGRTEIA
ncbi:hypothetical protein [Aquitalea sp. USM4]|uniref:hypothetical protein n=1 Tax=Aquitalea sp. USM4 TaxID=1590041 RepID=UPI0010408DF4|nr:hypothetical protein [Aquitalea sp. USM4]